jgi:hypothetical protein
MTAYGPKDGLGRDQLGALLHQTWGRAGRHLVHRRRVVGCEKKALSTASNIGGRRRHADQGQVGLLALADSSFSIWKGDRGWDGKEVLARTAWSLTMRSLGGVVSMSGVEVKCR